MTDTAHDHENGLTILRAIANGTRPQPPISATLGFWLESADEGVARFAGEPTSSLLNPMGTVHGGWAATILDSALGSAVMSTLDAESAYTTAHLSVHLVRPITPRPGASAATAASSIAEVASPPPRCGFSTERGASSRTARRLRPLFAQVALKCGSRARDAATARRSAIAGVLAFGGSLLFTTVAFPRYFDELRAIQGPSTQTPLTAALSGLGGTIMIVSLRVARARAPTPCLDEPRLSRGVAPRRWS
jgi:uncharacterized protein (TIGR00369 family)